MKHTAKTIKRLKELMKKPYMTYRRAAEIVGIPQGSVYRLVNNG